VAHERVSHGRKRALDASLGRNVPVILEHDPEKLQLFEQDPREDIGRNRPSSGARLTDIESGAMIGAKIVGN
jgi:hypothetical protein